MGKAIVIGRVWVLAAIRQPADQLGLIVRRVGRCWRAGRRPVLAAGLGAMSIAGAAAYNVRSLRSAAISVGGVRATLPWRVELVRLPGSVFLPTSDLPLVLAVAQIVVVLGLAEMLLGRWATLAVALAGHVVSTLVARLDIGFGALGVLSLSAGQAHALDTGPSAMTTAVGAWLLMRYRANICIILLGGALLIAGALQNNLDGREHLIAFCCGLLLGLVPSLRSRMVRRTRVNRHAKLALADHECES